MVVRVKPCGCDRGHSVKSKDVNSIHIRKTPFDNQRLSDLGVEVMTLKELRRRVPPSYFLLPERVEFFLLLLIDQGQGEHQIDFQNVTLEPGRLIFLQPGQVQHWHMSDTLQGTMVLVDTVVMPAQTLLPAVGPALADPLDAWPRSALLSPQDAKDIRHQMAQLQEECMRFDSNTAQSALDILLAKTLLSCLLIQITRVHSRAQPELLAHSSAHQLARLFGQHIESQLHHRPTVHALGERLGYSASSINRACLLATGRSAKQVIDERIALEAKRLLVHSKVSTSQIGIHLGFSEATNFLKFFKRMVGCTPDGFRHRQQRIP